MFSRSDKVISYFLLASIFTTAITVVPEPRLPLSYFLAGFALLFLVLYRRRQYFRKKYLLYALLCFGFHGVLCLTIGSTELDLFIPTLGLTVVLYLAFYLLISKVPSHIEIVRCYVKICFVVALIGLFQYLSYLVEFDLGHDYRSFLATKSPLGGFFGIRLASMLSEPSHVAYCLSPAIALATFRLVKIQTPFISLPQACVIILFAVLSQSTTVYVLVALSFLSVMFVRKGKIPLVASVLVAILLFSSSILNSGLLAGSLFRFTDLYTLFTAGLDAGAVNASSFTSYFNLHVAMENLRASYLFGGGIGSHALVFDDVYGRASYLANAYTRVSAGSLFNRLISELGIFGITAVCALVYYGFKRLKQLDGLYLVLHISFGIGLVSFLIRQGTYAQYGLAFYLLMFVMIPKLRLDTRR